MSINVYKQNQFNHMSIQDFTATLLDKAAFHIEQAGQAIVRQDYEKRVFLSNLATDILLGLKKYIVRVNSEQEPIAQMLENYYNDINVFITRMNIKNDLKAAQAIVQSLQTMAEMWREIGRQNNHVKTTMPNTILSSASPSDQKQNAVIFTA